MFAAGIGLFVAASAACALAGSVGALIAARAVQGAGAALIMPLAMALLSAALPNCVTSFRIWNGARSGRMRRHLLMRRSGPRSWKHRD
jgi:MFS family permease